MSFHNMSFSRSTSKWLSQMGVMGCLALAVSLSGCATANAPKRFKPKAEFIPPPVLNTEQFPLSAQSRTDAVHLKVNASGLSDNQLRALNNIAARASWDGGQPIDLTIVTNGSPQAQSMAHMARDYLVSRKVSSHVIAYTTNQAQPADVISLNMTEFRADIPNCNTAWENLAATRNNTAYQNFGCAVTANMAAQIADARDIAAPQAPTASDTGRRAMVIDKYRKGEKTSSESDEASKGTISNAVK
jgi:pilus assembly protein CpaD